MKKSREPNPAKVETEFRDALLTGCGGWSVLARLAKQPGLLRMLSGCVRVKSRAGGASDGEVLWSLVASLSRLGKPEARTLLGVARAFAKPVALAVVSHELVVGQLVRCQSAQTG